MGVWGLGTFVKGCYNDYKLRSKSKVVIDGTALLRFFLWQLHATSGLYGGEYQAYNDKCNSFLDAMIECEIETLIVFDGECPMSKFGKVEGRHKRKLQQYEKIVSHGGVADEATEKALKNLLPPFAMKCLTDALADVEEGMIEVITAPCEADPVIAREARVRRCPALTVDSDMIIFNNPEGNVDLNVQQEWCVEKDEDGKYIGCKRVLSKDVAEKLGIKVEQLPLFAAISQGIDFRYFHQYLETSDPRLGNPNDINRVFPWIAGFLKQHQNDAKALQNLRIRQDQLQQIRQLQKSYHTENIQTVGSYDTVPRRIKVLLDSKKLYHGALLVWRKGMLIPTKQIEDFSRPSCNDISRDIRCIWYSIICGGAKPNGKDGVEELSRSPGTSQAVKVLVPLKKNIGNLDLTNVDRLAEEDKRRIFSYGGLLEVDDQDIDIQRWIGDPSFEIPVRVTKFWLHKTAHEEKIKTRIIQFLENPMDQAQYKGNGGSFFNATLAHAYAEWQSCLQAAYDLNIILGSPLPDFKISKLLGNGSTLHQTENLFLGMASDLCTATVKTMDHHGGTMQLPDVHVTLKIPQGALKEPTQVSLSVEPYEDHPLLEENQLIFGPVVSCKPDGLTFLKPVMISLPHSGVNVNERCLQVWSKRGSKHSSWEKIYDGTDADIYQDDVSVAVEDNKIKFRVKHFTLFDVITVPVSMLISWLIPPAMVLDMYAYMDPVDVSTARGVRLRLYAIKRSDVTSRKTMEEKERRNACGMCCIPWCFVLKPNGNSLQVTALNIRPANKWIPDPHDGRGEIVYAHIQAGGTGSRCEIKYQPHVDMERADWLEGSFQTEQDGNPDIVHRTYFDDTTAQRNQMAGGQHDQNRPVRHPNEPEDGPSPRASSRGACAALEQSVISPIKTTCNTSGNQSGGSINPPKGNDSSTVTHKLGKPSATSTSSSDVVSLLEHCSITARSESVGSTTGDTGPFLKTVARKIEPKWREVAITLGFSANQCKEFEGTLALSTWWPAYKMLLAWQTKMSPCNFKQLLHILADAIRPLDEQFASQIIN